MKVLKKINKEIKLGKIFHEKIILGLISKALRKLIKQKTFIIFFSFLLLKYLNFHAQCNKLIRIKKIYTDLKDLVNFHQKKITTQKNKLTVIKIFIKKCRANYFKGLNIE